MHSHPPTSEADARARVLLDVADWLDPRVAVTDATMDHATAAVTADSLRATAASLTAPPPVFQLVPPGQVVVVTLPEGAHAGDDPAGIVEAAADAVAQMLGAAGCAVLPHGHTLASLDEDDLLRLGLVRTDNAQLRNHARLVAVLDDLDRCEHGRHKGDVCGGAGGCNGPSLGNPIAANRNWPSEPGQIGFDIARRPIVVPERERTRDPDAWVGGTRGGDHG